MVVCDEVDGHLLSQIDADNRVRNRDGLGIHVVNRAEVEVGVSCFDTDRGYP